MLVTGGTGFIGSFLVRALVERGDQVFATTRKVGSQFRLRLLGVEEKVTVVKTDLTDITSVNRVIGFVQPEVVFHLAAYGVKGTDGDLEAALNVNVGGPTHLLSACRGIGLTRLVWLGTSLEYSPQHSMPMTEESPLLPATVYGATKHAGWVMGRFLAAADSIPMVTARVFNVYGSMEHTSKFIPYVITKGLEGKPVDITSGHQVRDYLHVTDLVRAILSLDTVPGIEGMVFNLGSGTGIQVASLAERILGKLGRKDLLHRGIRQEIRVEAPSLVADIGRAKKILGWRPQVDLDTGIEKAITWYRKHRKLWGLIP